MMMMERSTSARSPFSGPMDRSHSISQPHTHHTESKSEPMDAASTSSPEADGQEHPVGPSDIVKTLSSSSLAIGSASNGPKPQTAFIHKLYSMLEDASIQHLISWSSSGESFVMSPTGEFSKVLSQYFKHTNVSSFVRQLNMYGFHKVNDVFHSTSPDSALWEFKHGNGSFKRGDLESLKVIRRRPSRPAIPKEPPYSGNRSTAPSAPGTPSEHVVDTIESRLTGLEQAFWDVNSRVHRLEDANNVLGNHCQSLLEGLTRCHQWTIDLSQYIARVIPPSDAPLLKEIQSRQKEIERYATSLEESIEVFQRERLPIFSFTQMDNGTPMSPRQNSIVDEDGRRPPPALRAGLGNGYFRPPFTSSHNGQLTPRRFGSMSGSLSGSISGPSGATPTSSIHPSSIDRLGPRASSVSSHASHLSRRHTSADIRLQGWNPPGNSPFSHQSAVQWGNSTSSRSCQPQNAHDEAPPSFSNYEIRQQPSHSRPPFSSIRKSPPPFEPSLASIGPDSTWSFATAKQTVSPSKFDAPPPPMGSRRGSIVASGVHALLNPSSAQDNISRPDHSSDKGSDTESAANEDSRKRKRVD
ncbi:hypothetical protein DRE_06964 [Drechslerella stenobrocha 248]|uniref:HSF-type DNA-binding domain-containing protein n=1 Tax=Drechslerella stenobrocha 248 TaxID=1043628 RepID=W7HM93_9PEZI|nr:hypothetical protein DRE_06964 [Drechslerella stenobrocha 248]